MVIEYKCPGVALNREVKVEIRKCLSCNYGVEMFSDENVVKCPKCGSEVRREETPSCINWCKYARKCLGERKWADLMRDIEKRQEK
jgi:predicted RNA-binding Zn-ribbon protein involved in translation (DUF1610 family)